MQNPFRTQNAERGMTLIELLGVFLIMSLIFGGIVAFLGTSYKSYRTTSDASEDQRLALLVMQQLTEDARKSTAITFTSPNQYTITRSPESALTTAIHVMYQNDPAGVKYAATDGLTPQLIAENASVSITDNSGTIDLKVTVKRGGAETAALATTIKRYNWGNGQ